MIAQLYIWNDCTIAYKEAVRREREKYRNGTTYEESDGENIDIVVKEGILSENNELYSENLTSAIPANSCIIEEEFVDSNESIPTIKIGEFQI